MRAKYLLIILSIISVAACGILNTLGDYSKLKFRISSAGVVKLGGIDVENKKGFEDLTSDEVAKLYRIIYNESVPVEFDLNVTVLNPNAAGSSIPVTEIILKSFPYKLYIDEKETISGNIDEQVLIPFTENEKVFTIKISVDLWDFYKGNNFNNTIEPVLKFGGSKGIISHIKLIAKPVIVTPAGEYDYPEEVNIVDYQFN